MRQVSVRAGGPASGPYGYANTAVLNSSSCVTMSGVTATASGSTVGNVGVLIEDSGTSVLSDVAVTGAGTNGYGLQVRTPGNGIAGNISASGSP